MAQFSPPHLAALAVLCIATVAAVAIARRHPGAPTDAVARSLAVLILAAWAGEYVADAIDGTWSARYTLPLQLTDAVSLAAATALLTRRRWAVELTWFWALSASLQATLTPDLAQSFPSVYYFTYFGYHIGAIVAGCMLVFGCGLYPRRSAWLRVFGVTLVWAAGAGIADLITGANYMYLRFRPRHGSLLALMGHWPWYILGGALIGLAMMLVLQRLADAISRRHPGALASDRAGASVPQP